MAKNNLLSVVAQAVQLRQIQKDYLKLKDFAFSMAPDELLKHTNIIQQEESNFDSLLEEILKTDQPVSLSNEPFGKLKAFSQGEFLCIPKELIREVIDNTQSQSLQTEQLSIFDNIMIDIETLGTKSNSVILSIAAVEFCLETGETGREFYKKVSLQSALDAGLKVYASTIEWWFKQSDPAKTDVFKDPIELQDVLSDLYGFICKNQDAKVWGNGSRFDLGLLSDAFEAKDMPTPWRHYNERDVRTLVSMAPHIKDDVPFIGIKHNPVDDCKHQIKYCFAIWKHIFF